MGYGLLAFVAPWFVHELGHALVAYWYFDDGGTTLDDKTSGARDGTILGPARTTTTYGYFWYPN